MSSVVGHLKELVPATDLSLEFFVVLLYILFVCLIAG